MGVFSQYFRFREAGEEANVNNVAEYGQPAKSLFTVSKVFTLHRRTEITDADGNVVYRSETKFPSLHDRTDVTDAQGRQVAHIDRKFWTLHERHFVTMTDGKSFQIATELFHLIKHIINIPELGWQLRGNIAALNFQLWDADGNIIAVIGQKFLSMHDKYCIDIYQPQLEAEVIAVLITLQHMIRDRENSNSASFSSSSSDS